MSDNFDLHGQPDTTPSPSSTPSGFGNDAFPATPATAVAPPNPERFVFTGRGSEYFRIWIVNLLLSIITVGIYSAWAKVRRLRYFYDNTKVADTSFDYHGNPIAILKGRVVAVVLLVAYNAAIAISPILGLIAVIAIALAAPWLIWRSLQFKLYNTSYRGIRFGFRGNAGGAYKNFLLWPVLGMLSVYLLAPMAHQRFKRFQHNESRFGTTYFSFHGSVGAFYKTYLIGLGFWLAGFVAILAAFAGTGAALATGGLHTAACISPSS
ncbi:MAG: Inner membrane protein YjgN [Herbaspirillum frisingense]|uniref:Inner membrane protein YjgN n=1 Tax=Herbaspirillum frisingense TaxID=92645 RepID=A0A7V8JVI8_9BURK|nr:MAG: Inner membrane protein YjgN [Herbaspirillum frisingense]